MTIASRSCSRERVLATSIISNKFKEKIDGFLMSVSKLLVSCILCHIPYTANISRRKKFVVFEVHRSSSKFLSLKVAAAPSLLSRS